MLALGAVQAIEFDARRDPEGQDAAHPCRDALARAGVRHDVEFVRAGEGYFSPDGKQVIYQAEVKEGGNPFYQIFVQDLATGNRRRISPGVGRTTCAYFRPDGKRVVLSSTHEDRDAKKHQINEFVQREKDKQTQLKQDQAAAAALEKFALEIRGLQKTEIGEIEEPFAKGQKGSSAMPHKRNPVLTENLTGLARMVRGYVTPALENVALWHERDISHSSVERYIGPDATITLDFALARLTGVVEKLLVYPARMQRNMDSMGGLIHSQRVLLALTQAGLSREESYALVQRNAMRVWQSEGRDNLLDLLKGDADVNKSLSNDALESLFDLDYHLKHVDTIFARVFGAVN